VAIIFHALTEDLSVEVLRLAGMFAPGSAPRALLLRAIRAPKWSGANLEFVSEVIAARYGPSVALKVVP